MKSDEIGGINMDLEVKSMRAKAFEIIGLLWQTSNYIGEDVNRIDLINPVHLFKVFSAINRNERIEFVLPAFPAKSGNGEKTHSRGPDLGEVEALRRLNHLAERMGAIHGPGAGIIICSDGRVFSDLVGVTEEDVTLYGEKLHRIKDSLGLDNIEFFNLEDFYPKKLNFGQMRYHLERDFATPLQQLKERVSSVEEVRTMFNGIHRFIKEDYLVIKVKENISKSRIHRMSKEAAYKVMMRSNAWSSLVEKKFPNAVRLSIHPQCAESEKFPIRLLPGPSEDQWGTPWHRVPVIRNGELMLMRHKDVQKLGGKIRKYLGEYIFFEIGESA